MSYTEEVVDTTEIFSGKIVKLRVDTVRLPDGRTSKREIVDHHGAVCIVPVNDQGEVMMVRQFRLAAGQELLEIPAGTLEEGEQPLECALRELEEETGYKASTMRPMFASYLAPGYSTELIHAYLATGLIKQENPLRQDNDEYVVVETFPLEKLIEMSLNGEIKDSKTISSLLAASLLLNATRI